MIDPENLRQSGQEIHSGNERLTPLVDYTVAALDPLPTMADRETMQPLSVTLELGRISLAQQVDLAEREQWPGILSLRWMLANHTYQEVEGVPLAKYIPPTSEVNRLLVVQPSVLGSKAGMMDIGRSQQRIFGRYHSYGVFDFDDESISRRHVSIGLFGNGMDLVGICDEGSVNGTYLKNH